MELRVCLSRVGLAAALVGVTLLVRQVARSLEPNGKTLGGTTGPVSVWANVFVGRGLIFRLPQAA
jgi:hypothetical protein